MDGTGVFFERLVEQLGKEIHTEIVSYPENEAFGYEQLLPHVTSRFPEEKPFVILGESFSGPLAAMAAAKAPENLKGIILVATFVRSPMPGFINKFKWLLRGPLVGLRPGPMFLLRIFCPDTDAETRRWFKEKIPTLTGKVMAARARAILAVNACRELRSTRVPVLYIAASRDRMVRRRSLEAVRLCRPDVEVKVLDGPHIILQTRPAEAAAVIKDFCLGLGRCPASSA